MPPLPILATFAHEDTFLRERTRDKALLIAIEYKRYPHNDVRELETLQEAERMRQHLIDHWGYLARNIILMREDDGNESMIPTRDNIVSAVVSLPQCSQQPRPCTPGPQFREIDNLVEDTKPGDRRVFFCTQFVSLNLRS
jgi:hypothetical protein